MKNSKLISWSLINAVLTALYVALIAWLMYNGGTYFGKAESFIMPLALLLLFVVSAAITGLLVFGRPIYLYLGGAKSEAIKLLFYTIGFLAFITIAVFITLVVIAIK